MNRREAIAALGTWALLPTAVKARPAALTDDVRIVRQALQLHPGLYRYSSPTRLDDRLDRFERDFVNAASLERRFLILSRFLASIRCGHSYCNFVNQRPAVAQALFDRPTRLPFHFTWIGRRMIVTRDPAGLGLAPGTEVVSINGLRAAAMLDSLMPFARADGHNDAKRRALLGVAGGEKIETFDVFHGLVYGAPPGGLHRLELRSAAGRRRSVEVPAVGLAQRLAQRITRSTAGGSAVWNWTLRPDGIALLEMPSWALYNSRWDWRGWLDERLSSLKGAKGLIVDLRDNEGGQDCGDALLARLTRTPIAIPPPERRIRFRRTPAALDPYLDTWDESFRTLGASASPAAGGYFVLPPLADDSTIAPAAPRVPVPVAALIGPVNSSATFQFAQKARASGLVKLFGETTGGNQRGINGGAFFFVRLPESGIEFDLPLIGFYPPGPAPDAGLEPDFRVAPTAVDLSLGRDPAMAAAADWLLGQAS
jgi:hypothetical protein